jgi:hypothetical protein
MTPEEFKKTPEYKMLPDDIGKMLSFSQQSGQSTGERKKRVFSSSKPILTVFKGEPDNDSCGWCLHGNFAALSEDEIRLLAAMATQEYGNRVGLDTALKNLVAEVSSGDYAQDQ